MSKLEIIIIIIITFLILSAASHANPKPDYDPPPKILLTRIDHIDSPQGYERVIVSYGSFSAYVRALPLKPPGSKVLTWDNQDITPATTRGQIKVIDWAPPSKVQQCADVAIRLHAEYLRSQNLISKIEYKSLSNHSINYVKWLKGMYKLSSGKISYVSGISRPDSDAEFEKYLQCVFAYANSSSLARDLKIIQESKLMPGDLYIQPDSTGRGGIGHVSVILNICENNEGERLYLFGYGFIPAQDFHLPMPSMDQGIGDWFTMEGYKEHVSQFGDGKFHRF